MTPSRFSQAVYQSRISGLGKKGAALVEYGILVGLVAVVAIGSVSALGGKTSETFTDVAASLSGTVAVDASEVAAGPVALTHGIHPWISPTGAEFVAGWFPVEDTQMVMDTFCEREGYQGPATDYVFTPFNTISARPNGTGYSGDYLQWSTPAWSVTPFSMTNNNNNWPFLTQITCQG
jgi:pilus assembly protein Flp/PilA